MRIAIGGISHETNTFNTVPTDLEQFQINTGKEILQSLKDTNTVIRTTCDRIGDSTGLRIP
jgi:microcystin degradation protein MlrC